jgi:spore coat protein U-like protein
VKWIRWILVFIAVICPVEAWAQQCTVSSLAVSFGSYDPTAGNSLNATGSISVTCTPATTSVVKLDTGHNSGGNFSQRKLQGDGDYLNYNLYTDTACTRIWGDGTSNTFTQSGGANLIVYGRIPPLQKVKPGVYSDFVTIVVEW